MISKVSRTTLPGHVYRLVAGFSLLLVSSWSPAAEPLDLDCVIEPHEVADVSITARGVMDTLEVERGDRVKKGQVLATLESSVEKATVDLARARAETDNLVRAQRVRLEFASKLLERRTDLSRTQAISSQEVDEARTDYELAKLELERVREENRIARLELGRAERSLALRSVTSPIDGVVVEINVTPGESIEDRPIMQIAQIDLLNVEVIAPVSMYGMIELGMPVEVRPEAPINGVYPATVSIVDQIVDAPSGTFSVRLLLTNPDAQLPAGLRCKARFIEPETVADR